MARQNHGPLSRAKGKLGGVVYQQYEGMQISREYQPVVKNPQTDKQTENRAKFKLSSQVVAQFKDVISARLSKLSIYERMRRAAAVNAIFNSVSTSTPSSPQALVTSVVNALNAKSISAYTAPLIEINQDGDFQITAANGNQVVVDIATYDATSGELTDLYTETYTSNATAKIFPGAEVGERIVLMAVGLIATTEAGRATISNVTNTATGWQNVIARAVAAGDVEVSNIVAQVATNE